MGQKNTRIDDSALETNYVSQNETLIYNFDHNKSNFDDLVKNEKNQLRLKSFSFIQKDSKIKNIMKKNSSEVFSNQGLNNKGLKPKHVKIEEESGIINAKPSVRNTFVNNFYVFLNKENTYQYQTNRSKMYYMPERKSSLKSEERKNLFRSSKRSKSISEIDESSIVSKVDTYLVQDFTDLELKTIKLTYQFIQDNLNNLGVIAFMKYIYLNNLKKIINEKKKIIIGALKHCLISSTNLNHSNFCP